MAKEKITAAVAATTEMFVQQNSLPENAAAIVTSVSKQLQETEWKFEDGKADITPQLGAAWGSQLGAIGVTAKQADDVLIATNYTLPFAAMNAIAEIAMVNHQKTKEQQNLRATGTIGDGVAEITADANVSSTYASATGGSSIKHVAMNHTVRREQTTLQVYLDAFRAAEASQPK